MARRFGDVAPVQLECLIHIDTLAERPASEKCAGSVKPSAAQLHPCGRARIREAKGASVCELQESRIGVVVARSLVEFQRPLPPSVIPRPASGA